MTSRLRHIIGRLIDPNAIPYEAILRFKTDAEFEDFLKNNYNNSMKEFLRDRKKVALQQKLDILLGGRIEVPNLICTKEMFVKNINERIIPLAIKKAQTG